MPHHTIDRVNFIIEQAAFSAARSSSAARRRLQRRSRTIGHSTRRNVRERHTPRQPKGLSDEQLALMERESASLAREFKAAEQSYGADHLDLVLAVGYVSKLRRNGKVVDYLAKHFQELLFEFQKITEAEIAAA